MNQTIFRSIISVAILSLIVSAVAIPLFSSASASNDTIENEGYFELAKYSPEDSVTLKWNYANPSVYEINGEEILFDNTYGIEISVMCGESFVVRSTSSSISCQFYGSGTYVTANSTNPELTVVYSGGAITATNQTITKAISNVNVVYCIAESGDYVMKKTTSIAYLKNTDEIFATGMTYFGSNSVLLSNVSGTLDNLRFTTPTYTTSNVDVHQAEDPRHVDTVKLSSISFDATNSAGDLTKTISYTYFIVPHSITVERTIHADESEAALINLVPLMILVGLTIGAIGLFISRRD